MAFRNMNRNRFHSFLEKKGALPRREPGMGEQDHASEPGRLKPHREMLAYGGYAGDAGSDYANYKEDYDGSNERGSDEDDDYPGYPDYKRDLDDDGVSHYYRGGPVTSDGEGSMDTRGRKQEDFAENQAYQSEDEKTGDPYIYNSSGEPHTNGLLRSKHNMEYMAEGGRVSETMSHQDDLDDKDELHQMHGAGSYGKPQRPSESFAKALSRRRRGMR